MKQEIKIFTNHVSGGWSPLDLDNMLGGSEECVVLLSEAFQRHGYKVTVYHSQTEQGELVCNGVKYLSREVAEIFNTDYLITFKDPTPYLQGAECKVKIHWSSEVERYWNTSAVDHHVNLSDYHSSRNGFADHREVVPMGIDLKHLLSHRVNKEADTVLYSSSPDRGLFRLLQDWKQIRTHYPDLELRVTYGFEVFDKITDGHGNDYKKMLSELIRQEGVKFLGSLTRDQMAREYWKAEHWILPLENPDSELFCLNALKSRFCGATPIVNKIGALKNTVGEYLKYSEFIEGVTQVTDSVSPVPVMDWDNVVENYWKPLLD